jgi:hypothetical protein
VSCNVTSVAILLATCYLCTDSNLSENQSKSISRRAFFFLSFFAVPAELIWRLLSLHFLYDLPYASLERNRVGITRSPCMADPASMPSSRVGILDIALRRRLGFAATQAEFLWFVER